MERISEDDRGFTLVGLLVVVSVMGVLVAIAVPQIAAYRQEGYNSRAVSDIRGLASARESFMALNGKYAGDVKSLIGFSSSTGVTIVTPGYGRKSFAAKATHGSGNRVFYWDSANGGLEGAT